jgi:hypothetical protein
MIAPTLDILFKSWCRGKGYDPADVHTIDRQTPKFRVLSGFADKGRLEKSFPGQTAFVYLIESNEVGGGSTVPPIISVESAEYQDFYEEWFPGLPPLQFVNPIFICPEYFKINVDNKEYPGVAPFGNIELWAHYLLCTPPRGANSDRVKLT